MTNAKEDGIVEIPSRHSVDETVEKLKTLLAAKGITLFALIDHSGEASKVGMAMPATKLLIFGSPAAGTPIMLAVPRSALDLPLKILIRENAEGGVLVSYNAPAFLQDRHQIPAELVGNVAGVEVLARRAAE